MEAGTSVFFFFLFFLIPIPLSLVFLPPPILPHYILPFIYASSTYPSRRNPRKVNFGNLVVAPPLSPGVLGFYPPHAQRPGTEMSSEATLSLCPNFALPWCQTAPLQDPFTFQGVSIVRGRIHGRTACYTV